MSDTLKLSVIGQNISYSQSKDIFEAVFRETGIDGSFQVFSIDPADLAATVDHLKENGFNGFSVTVPFKSPVIPLLDRVDQTARSLAAVNCVVNNNGILSGHNTDVFGFAHPLLWLKDRLRHGHALIFGHGGAASAAIYTLASTFDITRFTITGRSESGMKSFKDRMTAVLPTADISISTAESFDPSPDTHYAIAVNCTPLGGWNHPGQSPLPRTIAWSRIEIYYDLNYNSDNHVVKAALVAGKKTLDGSDMLVAQALESFRLWTGVTVDFDPIYRAIFGGRR